MSRPIRKEERRIAIMRELVAECGPEGRDILEIGPGPNPINVPCRKYISVDVQGKYRPTILHDVSGGIPLRGSSMDIVIAGEVLEHIYGSREFLAEARRVLRKGGSLIISVPNISYLKYRIAFALGRIPAHAARADRTYETGDPGHVRDYNFPELRKALIQSGFSIVRERTDSRCLPRTLGRSVIIRADRA